MISEQIHSLIYSVFHEMIVTYKLLEVYRDGRVYAYNIASQNKNIIVDLTRSSVSKTIIVMII